jgi:hypothetical protein
MIDPSYEDPSITSAKQVASTSDIVGPIIRREPEKIQVFMIIHPP